MSCQRPPTPRTRLVREAKSLMLKETYRHQENWKGLTTAGWMALFARGKLFPLQQKLKSHEERIRKLELTRRIDREMVKK